MVRLHLLLFVVFPLLASSQSRVFKESSPVWVKPVVYSTDVPDTLREGNTYRLLLDRQFNIGSSTGYWRRAIMVLSETGLESASYIRVNFDPSYQRLAFHSIIVKRKNLVIDKLPKSSFEILRREQNLDRLVYDKSLDAILNLDDVRVGDIVEYSYSLAGYNPVFDGKYSTTLYFNFGDPVGQLSTRLTVPSHRSLLFKNFNKAPDPISSKTTKEISYTWEAYHVPALMWDDRTPSWFDPHMNIEVTEYKSWEEVSHWAVPLYSVNQPPSSEIGRKVQEIQKVHADINEQINACIRFVQDEVRYLSFSDGIQGYKPHQPVRVFDQKFGDCKDKSLLLIDMLRRLGVESYPALVSTTLGKTLPESLPSPLMFDHCIASFSLDDSTYWVDPTISLQRGSLKYRTTPPYYNALVLSEKTKDLVSIPSRKEYPGTHVKEDFFVESIGGGTTLIVETTYYGRDAEDIRSYWKSNTTDEIKKSYTDFYANDYVGIRAKENIKFEDDEARNVLKVTENYSIGKLWEYDSVKEQYKAAFYARVIANLLTTPSSKTRSMPLAVNHPISTDHIITIHLPEPWTVTDTEKRIYAPGFFYSSKAEYRANTIRLSYAYQSLKDHVEMDKTANQIQKIKEASDDLNYLLTYSVATEKSKAVNGPFILITIGFGAILFYGLKKLYAFDPRAKNYSVGYDSISGFILLPVIGLLMNPLLILGTLSREGYYDYMQWRVLTDSSFGSYNPAVGGLVIFELLGNILLIGINVLCLILYFKRRTSLPPVLCGLLVFYVLFDAVNHIWMRSLDIALTSENDFNIFKSVLVAAIWIPVFLISDRVKGTFRERLKKS